MNVLLVNDRLCIKNVHLIVNKYDVIEIINYSESPNAIAFPKLYPFCDMTM